MFHPAVDLNAREPYAAGTRLLEAWNRFLEAQPEHFVRITSCADLSVCRDSGRIGILLGLQNSDHFRTADDVKSFYDLGQRTSQLTYNGPNRIGYGCLERKDLGLTPFGESVVAAMNAVGMVIDVSHAGDRTTLDTFEASVRPVLITHSNCKALAPHPRCKTDDVIRAMARKGGVMGITSIRAFVSRETNVTVDVARLVGPDHVGIGSDTDIEGCKLDVRGLSNVTRIYELTEGLVRRRYSDADIEGILGGNFRRVLGSILC
jgi:membrane dipeptidase